VKSKEDATEWLKRAAFDGGSEVEMRKVLETKDSDPELTPELRKKEERLRSRVTTRK